MNPRLIIFVLSSIPELIRLAKELYRLFDGDREAAKCQIGSFREECRKND